MEVEIVECSAVDDKLVKVMNRLIGQLSSSSRPLTLTELEDIVTSPATTLFLAVNQPPEESTNQPPEESTNMTNDSLSNVRFDHPELFHRQETGSLGIDSLNIVGVLTLLVFRIPTGIRSRIEDVVVDKTVRGRRIGERLCNAALDKARSLGSVNTDLTSRPDRKAANRLYHRMGFEQRNTNVYRFKL